MGHQSGLQDILDAVDEAARTPVVVGIDGRSGAGKSTLGRDLAHRLKPRAALVEGDDFYRDIPESERASEGPVGAGQSDETVAAQVGYNAINWMAAIAGGIAIAAILTRLRQPSG